MSRLDNTLKKNHSSLPFREICQCSCDFSHNKFVFMFQVPVDLESLQFRTRLLEFTGSPSVTVTRVFANKKRS